MLVWQPYLLLLSFPSAFLRHKDYSCLLLGQLFKQLLCTQISMPDCDTILLWTHCYYLFHRNILSWHTAAVDNALLHQLTKGLLFQTRSMLHPIGVRLWGDTKTHYKSEIILLKCLSQIISTHSTFHVFQPHRCKLLISKQKS